MGAFLSFILTIVIALWLFGLLARVFLRWWIVKKQKQFAEQFGNATRSTYNGKANDPTRRETKREGEVKISRTGAEDKKVNRRVGDYVEFEEVEITEETTDSK